MDPAGTKYGPNQCAPRSFCVLAAALGVPDQLHASLEQTWKGFVNIMRDLAGAKDDATEVRLPDELNGRIVQAKIIAGNKARAACADAPPATRKHNRRLQCGAPTRYMQSATTQVPKIICRTVEVQASAGQQFARGKDRRSVRV